MKTSRKMRLWVAALVCLFTPFPALAGDIYATGGWTRTIDASDLTAGAGSDLAASYESASDATDLETSVAGNYRVDVRRNVGSWDGALSLYVKRTSDGTGSGSVSGGTAYQEVTITSQEFFTGSLSRTDVHVQYQVDGLSIDVDPDTYATMVSYTITDL